MFQKLFVLIVFAVMAIATPLELAVRDWRNCQFSISTIEKCKLNPATGTPTKTTRVHIANVLTPSGNPISNVPSGNVNTPLTVHLTSHDEMIDGSLTINDLSVVKSSGDVDNKLNFAWAWINPESNRPETVTWKQDDDGSVTRYGCNKQTWSKDETQCSDTETPEDERVSDYDQRSKGRSGECSADIVQQVQLSCFFRCRD